MPPLADRPADIPVLARHFLEQVAGEGEVPRLTEDAVALTDGGGVYHAARNPIVGPSSVARLLIGLAAKARGATYEPAWIGGCPAMVARAPVKSERFAPVVVTLFGVRDGKIARIWTVSAPAKLG